MVKPDLPYLKNALLKQSKEKREIKVLCEKGFSST